jgi:uncharacterized protein YndB with AHSA1/START domain
MKRILSNLVLMILLMPGVFLLAAPEPVVTEAVINAPVDAVWNAFTTKAGLETWLVGKTEIELKVGGTWLTNYSKESNLKDDTTIHQTILALDTGRMLAFKTSKPPANFPFPGVTQTWTVVYFEQAPSGTRVVARMFGFGEDEQSLKMRAFFERGNKSELDKLVKLFQNGVAGTVK